MARDAVSFPSLSTPERSKGTFRHVDFKTRHNLVGLLSAVIVSIQLKNPINLNSELTLFFSRILIFMAIPHHIQ